MKKELLFIALLITCLASAQFNKLAPWMPKEDNAKELTVDQATVLFDQYWLTHDKNVKGSGYKPFMRWNECWKNLINPQGYLMNANELWTAFNQKNVQKANKSTTVLNLPTSNWQPVGPFTITTNGSWSTGQGRVQTVFVDPSNPNTIYIGAPGGGIWKSINSGTNWTPLSDNLPQIGVSGIAVDPNNSNIIYIATGDNDAGTTTSIGVMKSIDGGLTWNTTGLNSGNTPSDMCDILINPNDSNMLWVATSNGIFKSVDAGVTFLNVKSGSFSQGRIRLKPNDPSIVYACSSNGVFKSTNYGTSFSTLTSGLSNASGRRLLDVTPANPEVVYVFSSGNNAVFKSVNSGVSFTMSANTTDIFESSQSWYDLAFAVSPTNENEIYTGCLNIWRSLNGGATFVKRNNWSSPTSARYTHADIHCLRFFGTKLYCGSDGGVFVSSTPGTTTNFTNITAGLQIGQFYKIAVSKQSASKMVGGLQDNGGHAYSNSQWKAYYGADGMDTAVDPNNSDKFYGFIQNGTSLYVSNNAGNSNGGGIGSPAGANGNWVTPLAMNSIGELYSGFSELFKLVGGAWVQQNVVPFGFGNINLIKIDPSNNNIIYVSNGSDLYKSTDKGLNFDSVFSAPSGISSIEVHSSDSTIVYLTTEGTTGKVLKSIDGGTTFTSISQGLPNIGKNVIVHQGQSAINPLFVGTTLGVYYRDDTMSQWEAFDTNLPNISVTDLDINIEDAKITASTNGRGIWQSNIVLEVPAVDVKVFAMTPLTTSIINCTNTVTPSVTIKNSGLNAVTNFTINYTINSVVNSLPWSGTLVPSATTNITLPTQTLSKGVYNLTMECVALNDGNVSNNTQTTIFMLNDAGTINQVNTFENPTDEIIAYEDSGFAPTWQRGICTTGVVNTGANNVYTTNFTGNYPDVKKSFLVSQCYNISAVTNPVLKFKMAFDLEENFDIVYVQYSPDSGQNWYLLGLASDPNWYNSQRDSNTTGTDCDNCPGNQWTGTNATLTEYSFPLNMLTGFNNLIFRIVFHSDDATNALGVVVDDFVIEGTILGTQNFDLNKTAIYPNPSKDNFTISIGNAVPKTIDVMDVSGKTILSLNQFANNGNEIPLNMTNVSNGVYFVKITTDEQTVTKKIIKN